MRRVAVFTSSRADLGPLEPVIDAIDQHPALDLLVIATGTHLSESFAGDGSRLAARFPDRFVAIGAPIEVDEASSLGAYFGGIAGDVADVLTEHSVDVLALLGDRWELLAAAGAGLLAGVHIAHLHGGEVTEGAIDDRIRHGITKISDIHFCATEESARRLRQLGEEADRIIVSGAPGLDRLRSIEPLSDDELEALLGHPITRPFGLVVYHPPTIDRAVAEVEARAVYEAAASLGSAVVLYPGADPGADVVVEALEEIAAANPNLHVHRNLGTDYPSVLASADVMLGNSSSGIIEAPSLGTPVVNVGNRQGGRERAENVIDVETAAEVQTALATARSEEHRQRSRSVSNPYGDGRSGQRIAHALAEFDLDRSRVKSLPSSVAMVPADSVKVDRDATLRDALEAIDKGAMGIALLTDNDGLVGTLTDGDARRAILSGVGLDAPALSVCNTSPVSVSPVESPDDVLAEMLAHSISQVPVTGDANEVIGVYLLRGVVEEMVADARVFTD